MEPASIELPMAEAVEGGSSLAWRLLATLEGGSLLLATSALLAYTARRRFVKKRKTRRERAVHRVLITNTSNLLGYELKRRLEALGCTVTSEADSGSEASRVDALVVVGAEPRASGLEGMSELVTADVYENMKMLDTLAPRVKRGGYITWACAGATSGTFSGAAAAFDAALEASLSHAAKAVACEPLWVGRCNDTEDAVDKIVAALMSCTTAPENRYSISYAANKVSGYIGRWLKIIS